MTPHMTDKSSGSNVQICPKIMNVFHNYFAACISGVSPHDDPRRSQSHALPDGGYKVKL